MSTSILYHTQGIIGYTYQSTTYLNGACFFNISPKQDIIRCPICRSKDVQLRGSVDRSFMLIPVGKKNSLRTSKSLASSVPNARNFDR